MFCQCGCGKDAGVYRKHGKEGQPRKFIYRHAYVQPIQERFAKKYQIAKSGCYVWLNAKFKSGYGQFGVRGKSKLAHRIAWEIANGAIPDGLCVLHKCDNPGCVNPDHLFLGTQKDNVRDMVDKKRYSKRTGESGGLAKLKEAQVLEIRERYAAGGISQAVLGKQYGVCQSNIAAIVSGETWTEIEMRRI